MNIEPDSYVSTGSMARLRQSLNLSSDSEMASQIKDSTRAIVSRGVSDFQGRLETGQIKIETVADLERLVKLGLLVEGSATEITQDNSASAVIDISDEQYRELSEGEDFAELQSKLIAQLNSKNQTTLEEK